MSRVALVLWSSLAFATAAQAQSTAAPSTIAPSTTAPSTAAPSTTATPTDQLFFRSSNLIRYNPLGLITDNHISFRHLLYRADDNVVLKDNFVGAGFAPQVSAAFARLGALVEVQPVSVLRLWANFEVVGYFGTFGLLQSFDSPNADFSDTAIADRGRLPDGGPQKNFPTWGSQFTLGADLQLKVGPIAARNLFRLVRGSYQLRQGDTVYYDQFYDVLAPNNGVYLNNDTDLLFVTDFGLTAGLRMNVTQPFYGRDHFTFPERLSYVGLVDHQNGPTLRVGPIVNYTVFDDPAALFNKVSIIGVGNWWVAHRYRTGQDSPQVVPYVVLAVQVTTDLLPHLVTKRQRDARALSKGDEQAVEEAVDESEAEVKELREEREAEQAEREAERELREQEQQGEP